MRKCIEGSHAIAQVIGLCRPDVVAAFPITPQTHIVEALSKMKADGQADFEFINTDSEFASASIIQGASAAGGRAYTATSSQGLLLMTEVLFSIAGLRLPVVMTVANRAISSPINIWNDQQDSMTVRDAGWIMLYAQDNQAALDLHLLAFKLAEKLKVPAMVNMDGFVLTHTYEPVDVPPADLVKKFLPNYQPQPGQFLDVTNPVSLGCFATPDDYQEIRLELNQDLKKGLNLFEKESVTFNKIFKRKYKLVEYYGAKNPDKVIVSFGSLVGTIKDAVDELNQNKKNKVGVINIICYRPFPDVQIIKQLSKVKKIAVVEKDISLGAEGCLATDVKRALYGKTNSLIKSYPMGLGGRDIRKNEIKKIFQQL